MLALALCVLANILIAVCFKLFFRKGVDSLIAIVVNYWVCLILGSVYVGHVPIISYGLETRWVPFGIVLGMIFIVGFNITALSVRYTGITVTSVMQKMSLLMSAAFAIVFFSESSGILKLIGIALSVLAVVLINARKSKKDGHLQPGKYVLYPILTLVAAGLIEIILYYVQITGLSLDADAELTTFSFSVAAVLGLVLLTYLYVSGKRTFRWKDIIGGVALGIPNFFSIYLILVLLKKGFEGSVVFPVLNISVLVFATLVGMVVFREKLSRVNIAGIGLAILAILSIMLN